MVPAAYRRIGFQVDWGSPVPAVAAVPIGRATVLNQGQAVESPGDRLWPAAHLVLVEPAPDQAERAAGSAGQVAAALRAWCETAYPSDRIACVLVDEPWTGDLEAITRGLGLGPGDLLILSEDCVEALPRGPQVARVVLPDSPSLPDWGALFTEQLAGVPKLLCFDDDPGPVLHFNQEAAAVRERCPDRLCLGVQIHRLKKKRKRLAALIHPDDIVLLDRLVDNEPRHTENQEFARDILVILRGGRGLLYPFTSAKGERSWIVWEAGLPDSLRAHLFPVQRTRHKPVTRPELVRWIGDELPEILGSLPSPDPNAVQAERLRSLSKFARSRAMGEDLAGALYGQPQLVPAALTLGHYLASGDWGVAQRATVDVVELLRPDFWRVARWNKVRMQTVWDTGAALGAWFRADKVLTFTAPVWAPSNKPLVDLWAWEGKVGGATVRDRLSLIHALSNAGDIRFGLGNMTARLRKKTWTGPAARGVAVATAVTGLMYPPGADRLGHGLNLVMLHADLVRMRKNHLKDDVHADGTVVPGFESAVTAGTPSYQALERLWQALAEPGWATWRQVADWHTGRTQWTAAEPSPADVLLTAILSALGSR